MQTAAVLWHVSLLVADDRRALALGLVGLVRIVPILVFSLISGVAADALNRRRLMLVTQSLMALLAAILAALTLGGLRVVWPIYALAACSSAAGAFDLPARQSLLPTLVPREHLANAISLNTMAFQTASVAGPALGGILIATTNVGWVYGANAVSFLAVIVALLLMSASAGREYRASYGETSPEPLRGEGGREHEAFPEAAPADAHLASASKTFSVASAMHGLRFVFRAPLIRSTMLLDFFATFFSSATALLPIFAQDILGVGARGYGWLYGAPAAGALLASAGMVRAVDHIERRGEVLIASVLIYGAATIVFGVSHLFWLTFACLAMTGAADTVSMVFRNLIRQLETPDYLRGRMTGVNMIFFMGGPQLGEFEAGVAANWIGPVLSVVTGGVGCIAATVWLAWATPSLRAYSRTAAAAPRVPHKIEPG
ncbi:MAG: hypothetical protein A3H96_04325 [Acidobacteria bacterium RIFCSPLOWO2_02_FULL_67_36]|nr:MAG: hypothetical protein A3H96_04325 [Acidobacteria bacterium RIFCSPLOWO2_02_FULL_67_36]OFW26336.1 MAG: hypothetical protein A3G21_26970 [Acidobacteria bacterium RIFCSPLOWO2_12_FULL_66_21]